jgi:imidazolonepropionase
MSNLRKTWPCAGRRIDVDTRHLATKHGSARPWAGRVVVGPASLMGGIDSGQSGRLIGSAYPSREDMNFSSAMPSADGVWTDLHLVAGVLEESEQAVHDAAIVVSNGTIVWMGSQRALPTLYASMPQHLGRGALVTPGLIDCHTHLVYGGKRANEFAMRLAGASYAEIARTGGGIVSSVRATRASSEEELFIQAMPRLESLLAEGVCAIEIKSGYGLNLAHERTQLRVARRLGETFGVTVRTTFLGAHALPPEYTGKSQAYIDLVCKEMMPALASEGLIDAVDAFCETIGFSLSETEQVFRTAQDLGLPVKLHAEQLSNMGGSALAARYGALSCDHIEHLDADGITKMREAGTVAVLLPGAYYFLRDTHLPPISALREAGIPMAVATDHNPGTSPTLSLLLMMNMACTLFRLTVPEALAGVTRHAARALGLSKSHGRIGQGMPANFVLWPVDEVAELAYWLGQKPSPTVVRQGRVVKGLK